jgi:IclR family acetate operon transcriptional repressor
MTDLTTATSTSVERAFALLDLIAAAPDGLSLSELTARAPRSKSTTHRYVATLLGLGVVRRDEAGRLRPGLKLLELAAALLEDDDLRATASPLLADLARHTGETVHLGVLSEREVVYIAKIESPHSVRLVSRIGARVPLHCSAMGKALLASLPADELDAALAAPRERRTPNTLTGAAELRTEIERVRTSGIAIDDEENEAGVRCLGAAIAGPAGMAAGAISVSAPAGRMPLERCHELAPVVREASAEIGRRLTGARDAWSRATGERSIR